jgi:hypothetical protein
MNAKLKFREGWIMLLQPFDFANLSKPLQKLTILYAYSEKPIIEMSLTDKGYDLLNAADRKFVYKKAFLDDDDYSEELNRYTNQVINEHSTIEHYKGELVQCIVEGQMCRFYPEEYKVIERKTFEHILTATEYTMDIENHTMFEREEVTKRIHYIRSRGINKSLAERMSSADAKDAVIFRPKIELLEYFCRENEIY